MHVYVRVRKFSIVDGKKNIETKMRASRVYNNPENAESRVRVVSSWSS